MNPINWGWGWISRVAYLNMHGPQNLTVSPLRIVFSVAKSREEVFIGCCVVVSPESIFLKIHRYVQFSKWWQEQRENGVAFDSDSLDEHQEDWEDGQCTHLT